MEHENTLKYRKSQQNNEQTVIENLKNSKNKKKSSANESPKENETLSFLSTNIFMVILTVRTVSVCFNLIWDCDEVFNYWEPLHFVLFGNGFQTWEYSPQYSLRSYLYIFLHAVPLWPFKWFVSSKITLFYLLRFILAFFSSKIETYLFNTLLKVTSQNKNYARIAHFYIILSLTNAGMFLSTTSFLPSTFSMYLVMLAYAAWLRQSKKLVIFSVGLAVILGWPFAVILGLPLAIHMCFSSDLQVLKEKTLYFIKWTISFALIISVPSILFDSYLFGKVVFAPFNIVMYNVFPTNPNQGPDLYGTEPLSYYLLNCLLNFNVLCPLVLLTLLALGGAQYFYEEKSLRKDSKRLNNNFKIILSSLFLWFLVFFTRPHKEERFLYPVYPLILISASVSLNFICLAVSKMFRSFRFKWLVNKLPYLVLLLHGVLSLMRVVALLKNFSSALHVFEVLNKPEIKFGLPMLESKENINVCVQKEWYRFPSSFFMPENLETSVKKQTWKLGFLSLSPSGQLPGRFDEKKSMPFSTRHVDLLFNDQNEMVKERFVAISKCDFFIDTDHLSDDETIELNLDNVKTRWRTLAKLPFIDQAAESDRYLRAFYVPYLYERHVKITYFKLRVRMP